MAADGTSVSQPTRTGGMGPREALDGTAVYYRKNGGFWRMGLDLGPETEVLPRLNLLNNAAPVNHGVLLVAAVPMLSKSGQSNSVVRFFESTTSRTKDLAVIAGLIGWGLSAFSDGRSVLLTRVRTGESDLRLIKSYKHRSHSFQLHSKDHRHVSRANAVTPDRPDTDLGLQRRRAHTGVKGQYRRLSFSGASTVLPICRPLPERPLTTGTSTGSAFPGNLTRNSPNSG